MDWCQADKDYINKKRSVNDKTELVFVLKCFYGQKLQFTDFSSLAIIAF